MSSDEVDEGVRRVSPLLRGEAHGRSRPTELRRIQRRANLAHKAPVEPTPLERATRRVALVQHARVDVARVEDGLELGRDRVGRRVDQGEDVRHVLAEEGQRHRGVERVDSRGEGLAPPHGRDEGFAWGCTTAVSFAWAQDVEKARTVEELLVQLGELSARAGNVRSAGRACVGKEQAHWLASSEFVTSSLLTIPSHSNWLMTCLSKLCTTMPKPG